jgi:ABC-type multidrug transport system fused ATPase/permease subunit
MLMEQGITHNAQRQQSRHLKLTVLAFAGMLFYLDPRLALISLLILPFLFASLVMYARKSRVASCILHISTVS